MHGGDFLSRLRKGSSGAPRSLLQGCGRMLGVLSLAPGVLPGPQSPSGWRCPSGKSSAALALLVGSVPVPTSGQVPGGDVAHTVHVTGADAAVPSRLLPVRPRAHWQDKAGHPTGKVGCSQHHLEDKSCWVLHLFIASLAIIREIQKPKHLLFPWLWSSHAARRCPRALPPPSTVHPQAAETVLPPRAAPAWPGLSSSGSCPEPSLGAVQVWMGTGQYWASWGLGG